MLAPPPAEFLMARRLKPARQPENVGAAASQIFDGAPIQAGSPAEFYCSRPETGRRHG